MGSRRSASMGAPPLLSFTLLSTGTHAGSSSMSTQANQAPTPVEPSSNGAGQNELAHGPHRRVPRWLAGGDRRACSLPHLATKPEHGRTAPLRGAPRGAGTVSRTLDSLRITADRREDLRLAKRPRRSSDESLLPVRRPRSRGCACSLRSPTTLRAITHTHQPMEQSAEARLLL
jgi:hypothetical protein